MAAKRIRRILLYTHNAIGLGHVFRTLAVITGIRQWRPDIDFLVLSGTSVPQVLMRHGIDVVKLPGVKKAIGETGCPLTPRYLQSLSISEVLNFRRTVIREAHAFFKPEVVMVEHYLAGLAGEITPLLIEKKARKNRSDDFALVHLCRGLAGREENIDPDRQEADEPDSLEPDPYDFRYVFDDPGMPITEGPVGEAIPHRRNIRYLGRIADKSVAELPDRSVIVTRLRLGDRPILLLSLSRHGDIGGLSKSLMTAVYQAGLERHYQIVFVVDPYLPPEIIEKIKADPRFDVVRFLPFFYPLIDLIHASDIVICRAGYNIINELLLTDVRALVIPEHHPSGEQETRASRLPGDNLVVMSEEAVLFSPPTSVLIEMIKKERKSLGFRFDKYTIGKTLIEELETWHRSRHSGPSHF